jgi:hypothetical protein
MSRVRQTEQQKKGSQLPSDWKAKSAGKAKGLGPKKGK